MNFKIGHGYDVHRLESNRKFTIGGIEIDQHKGVTGHSLGAAGALEAVAVILSMKHQTIPMTHGTSEIDPEFEDLNLVHSNSISWNPGPTISNSFGFGGHNGSIVLGPA